MKSSSLFYTSSQRSLPVFIIGVPAGLYLQPAESSRIYCWSTRGIIPPASGVFPYLLLEYPRDYTSSQRSLPVFIIGVPAGLYLQPAESSRIYYWSTRGIIPPASGVFPYLLLEYPRDYTSSQRSLPVFIIGVPAELYLQPAESSRIYYWSTRGIIPPASGVFPYLLLEYPRDYTSSQRSLPVFIIGVPAGLYLQPAESSRIYYWSTRGIIPPASGVFPYLLLEYPRDYTSSQRSLPVFIIGVPPGLYLQPAESPRIYYWSTRGIIPPASGVSPYLLLEYPRDYSNFYNVKV